MESELLSFPVELFGLEFEERYQIVPYDIEPLNEEKRIRVYETQLLNTMLENSKTLRGFWFNLDVYEKTRDNLIKRFPHRETDIKYINMGFLAKMQYLFKIITNKIQL